MKPAGNAEFPLGSLGLVEGSMARAKTRSGPPGNDRKCDARAKRPSKQGRQVLVWLGLRGTRRMAAPTVSLDTRLAPLPLPSCPRSPGLLRSLAASGILACNACVYPTPFAPGSRPHIGRYLGSWIALYDGLPSPSGLVRCLDACLTDVPIAFEAYHL